jgi:hypothetical protein
MEWLNETRFAQKEGKKATLPTNGDLEVVLECCGRTRASREGCVEMAQAKEIRKSVGFDRRIAH